MNRLPTLLLAAVFAAAALTSQTLAQTCVTPPSCENLGYNKTAAMCAGLDILRCPFDDTKVFCSKKYMAQIAIGDILFSDMTTSSNPVTGKTPIGIVFDSNQKLALALSSKGSVLYTGDYLQKMFYFTPASASGHTLTQKLPMSFTLYLPYNKLKTDEDGKKNTQKLALSLSNYTTEITAELDDFIAPLTAAIQNGLDTYLDEARRSCIGCSEDDIQSRAKQLQLNDLNQIRSVFYAASNRVKEITSNLRENPYTDVLEYKTAGTNAGDWFIPSQSELKLIGMNFNMVLNSYRKLNITYHADYNTTPLISSTVQGEHISGIKLSNSCNTSDHEQDPCSYSLTDITLSNTGYTPVVYFPVINF